MRRERIMKWRARAVAAKTGHGPLQLLARRLALHPLEFLDGSAFANQLQSRSTTTSEEYGDANHQPRFREQTDMLLAPIRGRLPRTQTARREPCPMLRPRPRIPQVPRCDWNVDQTERILRNQDATTARGVLCFAAFRDGEARPPTPQAAQTDRCPLSRRLTPQLSGR